MSIVAPPPATTRKRSGRGMSPAECFYWGAFGAILPELLRLYKTIQAGNQPAFQLYYILISAAFVLAAGIFAIAWRPENAFKAIWVGISFPVLVAAMIQNTPTLPR
jgi:hypothetical protein